MRHRLSGILLVATCAFLWSALAQADVKPNALFTDHMVLQRDKPVKVWGTADSGEEVTVTLDDQTVETNATNGKWQVELKPLPAGGPHTLRIEGADAKIELTNVLVGEVWIASGQSKSAGVEIALCSERTTKRGIPVGPDAALAVTLTVVRVTAAWQLLPVDVAILSVHTVSA